MGTKQILDELKLYFTLMEYDTFILDDSSLLANHKRITLVAKNAVNYIYIEATNKPVRKQFRVNCNGTDLMKVDKTYDKICEVKEEILNCLKKVNL